MSMQKSKNLNDRIGRAYQGEYFLRVKKAADGKPEIIRLPVKLDRLSSMSKNRPDAIWLQSSRLMGTPADIKLLLSDTSKDAYSLSDELRRVIEYELTHPFTSTSIESSHEKETWGFDGSLNLVKQQRKSYRDLYSSELESIALTKKKNEEEKENDSLTLAFIKSVADELMKNPGCCEAVVPSGAIHSLKEFRVGHEQKRPNVTKNIVERIKFCQEQGHYLNVTDTDEDGKNARAVVNKPRTAIEFPLDNTALRNVFWIKKDGSSQGACNFLKKYWKSIGKSCTDDSVKREVERVEDKAPKQVAVVKQKVMKPIRVAEKNDLSLEPQSPRTVVANFDGPDF